MKMEGIKWDTETIISKIIKAMLVGILVKNAGKNEKRRF